MRAFADAMEEIVWTSDNNGANTYINQAFTEYTGLTREQAVGNGWQLAIHPTDINTMQERWWAAMPFALPFEMQARIRSAFGDYRLYRGAVFPQRNEQGELVQWIGCAHPADLDERADDRFRGLADALPLLVWTTDHDDRLTFVNHAWVEYTGLLAGSTIDERNALVHPDDVATLMTALRGGEGEAAFRLQRRRDKMYRWHLVRWERMHAGGNVPYTRIGTAIDIHELRTAQIERERAAQEQEYLAELGRIIYGSLDVRTTLSRIARASVPLLADWCEIDLFEDQVRIRAIAHRDETKHAELQTLIGKRPTEDSIATLYAKAGLGSAVAVPLQARDRTIGCITFVRGMRSSPYAQESMAFVEDVARRCAMAIQNAQMFEHEHRVADALQSASLPRNLPDVSGIEMDSLYIPARAEAMIGGDWYDAFVLVDGRIVISIGDVAGSGLDAAVTMSNMRQIIRGTAQVHADPGLMLHAADRALRLDEPERFVTAFVGVLDPVIGSMTYASAGHLPPLVRRADGSVIELTFSDLPLGLRERDSAPPHTVELLDGDLLVCYTDGLVESARNFETGLARLNLLLGEREIAAAPHPAAAIAHHMLPEGAHDDVAVLTLQIVPSAERASSIVRWSFPSLDADALHDLRKEFRAVLRVRDYGEVGIEAAELVLGELLGNAIRHAPGPVRVALDAANGTGVLHVIDEGPGFERAPMLPLDPLSESGRGLFIVNQLTREFSVTRRHPSGSHARAILTAQA